MGMCILTFTWMMPNNDVHISHYMINVNGKNVVNETSKLIAFPVKSCTNHLVTIRAVDRCGQVGDESDKFNLDPEVRPRIIIADVSSPVDTTSEPAINIATDCTCDMQMSRADKGEHFHKHFCDLL